MAQEQENNSVPPKFKIGSDICSIRRVEEVYDKYQERFLDRILTASEKEYVLSRKKKADMLARLAGRFAAKEATSKVLGSGFIGVSWKEIEVLRLPSGEPRLKLSGKAEERARELNLTHFELTMSHERDYAVAFVLGYCH